MEVLCQKSDTSSNFTRHYIGDQESNTDTGMLDHNAFFAKTASLQARSKDSELHWDYVGDQESYSDTGMLHCNAFF